MTFTIDTERLEVLVDILNMYKELACNFIFSYCGSNIPDDVTLTGTAAKKGLKVTFLSDKKRVGRGAQCVAQCIDGSATTSTTSTTTNFNSGIVQNS